MRPPIAAISHFEIQMELGEPGNPNNWPMFTITSAPAYAGTVPLDLQREAALALAHYYADTADWSSNPNGTLLKMTVVEVTEDRETILRVGHHA